MLKSLLNRFHRDESGAVLMVMLVVCVVLMMMAWLLYDTGEAAREKIKTQAAADMAAMSQASVKARSMNMLAYSNIAKRSIFAIHTTYHASFLAYLDWATLFKTLGRMLQGRLSSDESDQGESKIPELFSWIGDDMTQMLKGEAIGNPGSSKDFANFSGVNVEGAIPGDSSESLNERLVRDVQWLELLSDVELSQILGPLLTGNVGEVIGRAAQTSYRCLVNQVRVVPYADAQTVQDREGEDPVCGDPQSGGSAIDSFLYPGAPGGQEWAGYSVEYIAQDLVALDNYQRYLVGMTPMWAWSEQLTKGIRNGADATASFPVPPGMKSKGTQLAGYVVSSAGAFQDTQGTGVLDTLPVRPGDGVWFEEHAPDHDQRMSMPEAIRDGFTDGISGTLSMLESALSSLIGGDASPSPSAAQSAFMLEHIVNLVVTAQASHYPLRDGDPPPFETTATEDAVMEFLKAGLPAFHALVTHERFWFGGLDFTKKIIDERVRRYSAAPWGLMHHEREALWLMSTSNIVFAINARPEAFDEDREKFEFGGSDYRHTLAGTGQSGSGASLVADTIYKTSGMWGLARSEIFYLRADPTVDAKPDMWNPVWTARLRPLMFPGEMSTNGVTWPAMYHEVVGSLAVVRTVLGEFDPYAVVQSLVQMERSMQAAEVGGISK